MKFSKEVKKIIADSTAFYDAGNIMSLDAIWNVIFGKRSNGKTFGILEHGIRQYCSGKGQMALIRRWTEDFSKKNCDVMFDALVKKGLIEKYTNGEWTDVFYQSKRWYFSKIDPETNKPIVDKVPFCFGFPLTTWMHDKSTSYPNVNTIVFDEFMTRGQYLPDEFVIFCNVCSTIIRERSPESGPRIFLLGNTVSDDCPYFDEMGLLHVQQMQKGTIDLYEYDTDDKDVKLTVAVEYCTTNSAGHKSDVYFAFDNPKLKMITSGEWEFDLYPHKPQKFNREDILFTYFVIYNHQKMQIDIIKSKQGLWSYCHERIGEIPEKSLVYSQDYDIRPNRKRNIIHDKSEVGVKIMNFYYKDKMFYQNNKIGDNFRNYLLWCK